MSLQAEQREKEQEKEKQRKQREEARGGGKGKGGELPKALHAAVCWFAEGEGGCEMSSSYTSEPIVGQEVGSAASAVHDIIQQHREVMEVCVPATQNPDRCHVRPLLYTAPHDTRYPPHAMLQPTRSRATV